MEGVTQERSLEEEEPCWSLYVTSQCPNHNAGLQVPIPEFIEMQNGGMIFYKDELIFMQRPSKKLTTTN